MRYRFIALILSAAALAAADEKVLTLDPGRTTVQWILGGSLHTVHGTFQFRRGSVVFDPAGGPASGELIVDATSGESGSGARDSRMHKSIIESKTYPDFVFTPDRLDGKVAASGVSDVKLHGMFKIHGAAHEMTLPAKVEASAGQLTITTQFEIPYVDWGMKNPSNFLLKVDPKVEVEIKAAGKLTAR